MEVAQCKTCKFWQPSYFHHGKCTREYAPHSKVHSEGGNEARIMTHQTFHCSEYEHNKPQAEETL